MSRRADRPQPGLDALWAAVAEQRREELARAARTGLTGRDLSEPGRRLPARVSGRRVRAGSVPSPREVTTDPPDTPAAELTTLVSRAQGGDAEAFGQLYDRYVDLVYRYCVFRLASTQQAEDMTSETFTRALKGLKRFTWQGRDIGAWFITIARNLIADHYKSARYRLEVTSDDVEAAGGSPQVAGPEAALVARFESTALLDAVRQLKPEQQECVALRFLQGLSVAETAAVMGKNEQSIKSLQYRAVQRLGALLPDRAAL